ncbi:MAG: ATP-binding domain-containing protein [Bdellovibrio bacteriovorus]
MRQNGPFPIQWESSDEKESADLWRRLEMPERWSVPDALTGLEPHCDVPAMRTVREWVAQQRRILGVQEVTAEEVRRKLNRTLAARRRYGGRAQAEFVAMTIPQAKNREFDHVVVIWPYTVPNDDEQKRRLLYNAITRAKRSCHVLVQAQKLCDAPPFVG